MDRTLQAQASQNDMPTLSDDDFIAPEDEFSEESF